MLAMCGNVQDWDWWGIANRVTGRKLISGTTERDVLRLAIRFSAAPWSLVGSTALQGISCEVFANLQRITRVDDSACLGSPSGSMVDEIICNGCKSA